jgi:hypothetical protein
VCVNAKPNRIAEGSLACYNSQACSFVNRVEKISALFWFHVFGSVMIEYNL